MEIKILASGSKGNCIYIADEECKGLLDCGVSVKCVQEKIGHKVSGLDFILCSHQHLDHVKYVNKFIKYGIDCYMNKETKEALNVNSHRTKIIETLKRFSVRSFDILPFNLTHDVPNTGYMLESKYGDKAVYIVDTPYCKYKFKNLTHVLIGCNYSSEIAKHGDQQKYNRVLNAHMSIESAAEFIKINKSEHLKEVYLLHLSNDNSNEAKFVKTIKKIVGNKVRVIA